MQQNFPFQPRGENQNPPVGQASGAVGVAVTQITIAGTPVETETSMRLMVDGAQPIAWCYGTQAALTYALGVPMLANSMEVFMCPAGVTALSVIALATGSTLRINLGDGQ